VMETCDGLVHLMVASVEDEPDEEGDGAEGVEPCRRRSWHLCCYESEMCYCWGSIMSIVAHASSYLRIGQITPQHPSTQSSMQGTPLSHPTRLARRWL